MRRKKLGVSYNLFNGEELLRDSILNIRECVDYINVVWQPYSWTHEKANPEMEIILESLKAEGLIDNVIKFDFDLKKKHDYKKLKCIKKNKGIADLRKARCTHFMLMDADEFYVKEEFLKAKEFVFNNNITHSVCSIYDYRILPCYRMLEARDYCVSFIFKLTPLSHVVARGRINNMPCLIDPHRAVPLVPLIHKFYYLNMINMHHMTGVRKDYSNKMRNSLSNHLEGGKEAIEAYSELQRKMEMMTEQEILDSGYVKVDDRFSIMKHWNN